MSAVYNDEQLDAMDDNALAHIADHFPKEASKLHQLAGKATLILRQRMEERGATKLDTDDWAGTLKGNGYNHTIDNTLGLIEALWPHLTDEEKERVRPTPAAPEPNWNHKELNELVKRGGAIREAIESHRSSAPKPATLELKAKQPVEAVA